ncbi:FAD-dependent oxidoreductase [Beijerinckia sp. L45]|uniref:flavin monoamine oxidase family protein n=1 Tax=Beijerinckia sp. L45 TaxID=1641855 RepID=UPI00131CD50E|nr:FAD-dependent oxidoreductase [Beijerinckia sp. L45]
MTKTRIAIVGGGLSGLFAARLLAAAGIEFRLFEARSRLGGRILSVAAGNTESNRPGELDLGPSWFWPATQPLMTALVAELGLTAFPQYAEGDVVLELLAREAPRHLKGYRQEPSSFRIAGGTAALIAALATRLPSHRIELGVRIKKAESHGAGVTLHALTREGEHRSIEAEGVLFALPPRLIEASITFDPPMAPEVAALWRATPTWMAPHAKFVAVYDRPFWRERGLSGAARSMVGPLAETHDATAHAGVPALFGFLGVPSKVRAVMGSTLTDACEQHLVRLFGPEAANPSATHLKDWSIDRLTATDSDRRGDGGHPSPSLRPWTDRAWASQLVLAGSETASVNPGYLEGALEAAHSAVSALVSSEPPSTARKAVTTCFAEAFADVSERNI